MQALGRPAGGGSLSGMLLCVTQVRDGLDERSEAHDQHDLGGVRVAANGHDGGQQSGRAAQAVPGRGWAGNAPVRGPGGAIVESAACQTTRLPSADGIPRVNLNSDAVITKSAAACSGSRLQRLLTRPPRGAPGCPAPVKGRIHGTSARPEPAGHA